jgi:four helix bundle protein
MTQTAQTLTTLRPNRFRELEDRTEVFAINVIKFCKDLPKNTINNPLISQVIRSAGSVGANYREANEAVGKKDFVYRLRIARKESKETSYWLKLISEANNSSSLGLVSLINEADELRNILSAIINKVV